MPNRLRRMGAVLALALAASGITAPAATGRTTASVEREPCAPVDTEVTEPYALTGFWMYPRIRPCGWRDTLQRVHRIGGDTVIQFAPQLTARRISADGEVLTFDGSREDPNFSACHEAGSTCYEAAVEAVRAAHPGNTIDRVYAYATADAFTDELMVCPELEEKVAVPVDTGAFRHIRLFWLLLLPADDPSSTDCSTDQPREYHLVLVAGERNNSLGTLLREAQRFGMKVYAPMPAYPAPPGRPWDVHTAHDRVFTAFDQRVLRDYARQYSALDSFAGVYQSREYMLNPGFTKFLDVYRDQHADVRRILPGREILASPYWNALRYADPTGDDPNPTVTTADDVAESIKQIAETGVDIIAPQDGRGTGSAGLFWPYESDDPVDPRLEAMAGQRTYGNAYITNSTALFRAAARARDRLAAEGRSIELWANVEAFEPGGTPRCGNLHRTGKERLDQALTHLGTHVSKVISFMWDPLFTCAPGGTTALADQIVADHDRPVVSAASRHTSAGSHGVLLHGYHLDAASVRLTWYDGDWQLHSTRVDVDDHGWYDADAGRSDDALPDPMEAAWAPFSWQDLAPDFYVHITVRGGTGKTSTHRYSLAY